MRYLFADSGRPRGTRPLHPVRLEAHRERSVRRQNQSVGSPSCLRHSSANQHAVLEDASGEFLLARFKIVIETTTFFVIFQEHTGRVFRLQFDEFQIVSSSHDDTILIWDFLNCSQKEETTTPQTLVQVGRSPSREYSSSSAAGGRAQPQQETDDDDAY